MGQGRISVPPLEEGTMGAFNQESIKRLKKIYDDLKSGEQEGAKLLHEIINNSYGEDYTSKISTALFGHWSNSYDSDMYIHEVAIRRLIRMIAKIQPMLKHPIFRGRTLEMSCGTGMVIDAIWETLTENEKLRMNFVANDITVQMIEKAINRFSMKEPYSVPFIDFTCQDIRTLDVTGIFDTVILSQTLHLITDPELIRREELGDKTGGSQHRRIKKMVIKKAFEALKNNGHIIIIDEFPAVLSDSSDRLKSELFKRTLRPIESREAIRDMMAQINGTRLVCEFKVNIDFRHSMYIYAYKKDEDKLNRRGEFCTDKERLKFASQRVRDKLTVTDSEFVDSFSPIEPGWTNLIPISDVPPTVITTPTLEFASSDFIVLDGVMHKVPDDYRDQMIDNAVSSINPGGALLISDEWHYRSEVYPNPISRKYLRDKMAIDYEGTLIFQAAYREPIQQGCDNGVTGFMFRKKDVN